MASSFQAFIAELASKVVLGKTPAITRVAINGVDGSGKSYMADALAEALVQRGERVIQSSVDFFHNPRSVRYAKGRDSPEGFYRDSFSIEALKTRLLEPLGPGGCRVYKTKHFDYRMDQTVDADAETARDGDVLVFDGIFLFTPELTPLWDVKVFLEVSFEETFRRMMIRDGSDPEEHAASNRRYRLGQQLYLDECRPAELADIVIDNRDFDHPRFMRG
jgi:uridine kinase